MEKKWNPGPWTYYREECFVVKDCDLDISVILGFSDRKTEEATAVLISAAPELYDALEDCEYWLSAPPTSQSDRECVANVIKKARAVMAKARGEDAKQETP